MSLERKLKSGKSTRFCQDKTFGVNMVEIRRRSQAAYPLQPNLNTLWDVHNAGVAWRYVVYVKIFSHILLPLGAESNVFIVVLKESSR